MRPGWLIIGYFGAVSERFEARRYALTYLARPWMHLDLHGGIGSTGAGSPRWIGIGVRQRAAR